MMYFLNKMKTRKSGMDTRVTAAICKGNVMATQFHPEKSGEAGLRMLKRFAEWKGESSC